MECGVDAAVALDVTPRPTPFDFVVGDRTKRCLQLSNPSFHVSLHFKIQCTASSRFRLHPSKGILGPHAAVAVQIQLSTQATTEGDCVFLVLALPFLHNSATDGNADVWKHAAPTMISKQYISSRIISAPVPDFLEDDLPRCHSSPRPASYTTDSYPPILSSPSYIKTLLIKNKSRLPANQLTAAEIACLRQHKLHVSVDEWSQLMASAMAQRKELRVQRHCLCRPAPKQPQSHLSFDRDISPSSPCSRSDTSSIDGRSLRAMRGRSGSSTCSSTCESGGAESTAAEMAYSGHDVLDGGDCKESRDNHRKGRTGASSNQWTRYMLDVCVQQLAHVDETCTDMTTTMELPKKARTTLLALRNAANTLVDLCRRHPFLHEQDEGGDPRDDGTASNASLRSSTDFSYRNRNELT
ncbi:hypothetical protein H310_14336 [Aphanomyces invadans]|uniref:MSP domain-containing protein n=1 Tax=Aphanomyces invadans TaxID=157072 RepID=A0A024TAE3_9STRA|nr:hypothetical protein H310_14336 [Aphanomyces invadans]ETV91003.1 hypothetical protein H310_14336 [Aphanomyces invadans]|eukprot:XP_008880392.1 hypothetical protein H310_14336 [Aphanomyces invadans]